MQHDVESGTSPALKKEVAAFWDREPCGSETSKAPTGSLDYFREIEAFRYRLEPHILELAKFASHAGERVLEVGCGIGTDAVSFARAGAHVTAIDMSTNSLAIARQRFQIEGLSGDFRQGDAEDLPYLDNSFDFAYSHGVLHHVPRPDVAVAEIRRVLRPGGRALVMLYHRDSYNYLVDIRLLRRLGRWLLKTGVSPSFLSRVTNFDRGLLEQHQRRARQASFNAASFLNDNTDGPGNPLSRVYSRKQARRLFSEFVDVTTSVRFFDRRHVPLVGALLPGVFCRAPGRLLGWHLYISARKRTYESSDGHRRQESLT